MGTESLRPLLEQLETSAGDVDVRPALALAAGRDVELEPSELSAARRRAMLLLAAGGDPHSSLDLEGRAVRSLADDLARESRQAQLIDSLTALLDDAGGLAFVRVALETLLADRDLAWRCFACALLADELGAG